MAKAAKKSTTNRKAKGAAKKRSKKAAPREGLDLISAAFQRRTSTKPDLKGELRLLRKSEDVESLIVIYDAYVAASNAILGIQNQPRAQGTDPLLNDECGQLILKAWTVAEHLKSLRPLPGVDQERFVQTLFDCAINMGHGMPVLRAALAVGTADDRDSK
jgi:hypothetical protein